MSTIGIFSGKTKDKEILTSLFYEGPLTALEITNLLIDANRQSLHATLNKRLRGLEKKEYVHRENKKWLLRCKGVIAVLLVEPDAKAWSPKWKENFRNALVMINESTSLRGVKQEDIGNTIHDMGLCFDDLNAWKGFAKIAKGLIDKGVIDFGDVKDSTLLSLVVMEAMSLEDVSSLFKPENSKNNT